MSTSRAGIIELSHNAINIGTLFLAVSLARLPWNNLFNAWRVNLVLYNKGLSIKGVWKGEKEAGREGEKRSWQRKKSLYNVWTQRGEEVVLISY